MFTTVTPLPQLVSMPNKAATPPKLAPYPTLVGTAITNDEAWSRQLVDARHIDRLNVGAVPTCALNWLQPHEGNMFEFLYKRRSIGLAA